MRSLRIKNSEDEAGYFHLIARCVGKRFYFESPEERRMVKLWLDKAVAFCGVRLYSYCIMSNHVHLLVQVPPRREVSDAELDAKMRVFYLPSRYDAIRSQWATWRRIDGNDRRVDEAKARLKRRMFDVSMFMKTFKQCVAEDYNLRNRHSGSIWGGARFKSVYIDGSWKVMSTVMSYIHLNPVRAGIVVSAGDYAWSSYGNAVRGDKTDRDNLLALFTDCGEGECEWKDVAELQENRGRETGDDDNPLTVRSQNLSGSLIVACSTDYVRELFARNGIKDRPQATFFSRRKQRKAKALERIAGLVGLGGRKLIVAA